MPVSDQLLAIFSMDTYNRGYDAQLKDTSGVDSDGLGGKNSTLGGAKVVRENSITEARNVGFHAVAYNVDGQIVIAYRGTDEFLIDVPFGYTIGTGIPDGAQAVCCIGRRHVQLLLVKGRLSGLLEGHPPPLDSPDRADHANSVIQM